MLGSGHCSRKPEAVASGLAAGIYVAAGRNHAGRSPQPLRGRLLSGGGRAMLAPQDVAIFLNNELKPTHQVAELDRDTALPDAIRDMPDQVCGRFIDLDASLMHAIEVAWKRVKAP